MCSSGNTDSVARGASKGPEDSTDEGRSGDEGRPGSAGHGQVVELALSFWRVRFLRFLLVGVLNTVFGYAVFATFILLGIHYALAAFLGTLLAIAFNFKTTGTIVFRSHDNRLILRFFCVYAITYVVGIAVLKTFKSFGIHVLVTAAVTTLPMAALSFLLMRWFVFGANSPGPAEPPAP